MCAWGKATALGPNINLPLGPAAAEDAYEAAQLALRLSKNATPVEQAPVEQAPAEPAQAAEPSFEERVAEAKQNQPPPEPAAEETTPVQEPVARTVVEQPAPQNQRRLRTIDELRLNGTLQLPELHLDIHVYAEDPAERFVFVNMKKHKEGSQLAEGPVVAEITNDGAVLEHRGLTFLLPRE